MDFYFYLIFTSNQFSKKHSISMNFLAHVFLTKKNTALMVGNFVADFLKGNKHEETYPFDVLEGIQLHRKIDKFTDQHEVVKAGYQMLKPLQGRYASVTLDIYYDYFLVKNWEQYSSLNLEQFTQSIYQRLEDYMELYPPFLQRRLPLMIGDNWLVRYGTIDGLAFTFSKMANRASKPAAFQRAVQDLQTYETELNKNFNAFFPDLAKFVELEMEDAIENIEKNQGS